jgi:hypothetical protein
VSLEGLEPEQRAVLELLLARGRSYAFVAGALDLDDEDVEQKAHDALRELTPVTSPRVGALDREAIGNLVLGQATAAQKSEAHAALARPSAAREWAASLLDSLDGVAKPGALPELPPIQRGPGGSGLRPPARVLAAALAVLIAAAAGAYALGRSGDSGGGKGSAAAGKTTTAAAQPKVEKQGQFVASRGETATGAAVVYDQGGAKTLAVQAQVKESTKTDSYEVWLYNSDTDLRPVGVRVTDANGVLQGAAQVPKDYSKFRSVVLSREKTNTSPKKPTTIVARAPLAAPSGG